jgi:hypothetical protein
MTNLLLIPIVSHIEQGFFLGVTMLTRSSYRYSKQDKELEGDRKGNKLKYRSYGTTTPVQ